MTVQPPPDGFVGVYSPICWTLPSNLQSLSFGNSFNQNIEELELPRGLRHLTFGDEFNQCMDKIKLPDSLESLTCGQNFNNGIHNIKAAEPRSDPSVSRIFYTDVDKSCDASFCKSEAGATHIFLDELIPIVAPDSGDVLGHLTPLS